MHHDLFKGKSAKLKSVPNYQGILQLYFNLQVHKKPTLQYAQHVFSASQNLLCHDNMENILGPATNNTTKTHVNNTW